MIVKKIPILKGFPDFSTVKKLSEFHLGTADFRPVFYDIETTGLSRYSTFLYLIGTVTYENGKWILFQWMAEKPEEETSILHRFSDFLKDHTCTIQYNGNRFDQPYMEERYRQNALIPPFENIPSLDLYQELKICRPLLGLSRMKQPDLEAFLGRSPRRYCDGGKCIHLYRDYSRNRDSTLAETILGHNREDLLGLGGIIPMLGYSALYHGTYSLTKTEILDDDILFSIKLPGSVPVRIFMENDLFSLTADKNEVQMKFPIINGKIRQYFKNYKDYDYLPAEDTAISRYISQYMDKSLRIPATPSTCYTWVSCSKKFLETKELQLHFLQNSLPCLLGQLPLK